MLIFKKNCMKDFDENLLSANDLSAFECFSITGNRDHVLKEVNRLGDNELSKAYEDFFKEEENDLEDALEEMYQKDDQLMLVQKSLKLGNFAWIKLLLKDKKRAISWYVEKLIAETLDNEIIKLLLKRPEIGWSAQAIIVEQNNEDWIMSLVKKQTGLSPFVKEYIINNASDACVIELIKRSFLSPDIEVAITRKRNTNCIKTLLNKHKHLPNEVFIEIIKSGNDELIECLASRNDIEDDVISYFVRNSFGHESVIDKILSKHYRTLSALTQREIILSENPKFIKHVAKLTYRIPDFRKMIIKSLNLSLIKECVL